MEKERIEKAIIAIGGMSSAACVAVLEKTLKSLPGIPGVSVSLVSEGASPRFNPEKVKPQEIIKAIEASSVSVVTNALLLNRYNFQVLRVK